MKADHLNGKQVITSEAQVLGEIEGVDIDVSNWTVTHLHVSLLKSNVEKFNYKKPFFGSVSVCLPVTTIKTVGDIISLKESINDLKHLPEFKIQE